jgi:DNA polymerase
MTKITIDFETQSEFDLKRGGAAEYSMHPSTRVLCLAFTNTAGIQIIKFNQMQNPWRLYSPGFTNLWQDWIDDPNIIFASHNAFFEQMIYNNILVKRLGWPPIPAHKWVCTAAKAAAAAIPRNLADAGAVMRTQTQKDFEGHQVMLRLCKPTKAWTAWKKANNEIKNGARVGTKKKEMAARPEPLKFHTPETAPDDFKKLYQYCLIDVRSEILLDESLPDLTPTEQRLWFIDQKINMRGVYVDRKAVDKISEIMVLEQKTMVKELDFLTMGLVSSGNARNAILDFLTLEGIELPDLRAKTVSDFLANGEMTGDAKKILEIRRALSKASTAKYKMFKLRSGTDGRVRDLLLYCGAARTGRWAGKGLQPQNFPRGVVKDISEAIRRIKIEDVEMLKLLYGENLMPLFSSVLRGMFSATPGHELFVQDYNAIECRVAWWLAGHEKGLQMFRLGQDPYWQMAKAIYNLPSSLVYDSDNKEHQEMRQVGKAAVLGCGYQMGERKFVTSAWDIYRAKVDKNMAKKAVQKYREVHFPVQEIWENFETAAIAATENPGTTYRVGRVTFCRKNRFLQIELPSGRRLSYCDPQTAISKTYVMTSTIDGEVSYAQTFEAAKALHEKGYRKTNEFFSKKLSYFEVNQMAKKADTVIPKWAKESTYGGKLFENVVQAVARDILAEAIIRAEKYGFNILLHSHDELVSEAPKGKFESEEYKKVMEQLPAWANGLPLKSSGWVGSRYRK